MRSAWPSLCLPIGRSLYPLGLPTLPLWWWKVRLCLSRRERRPARPAFLTVFQVIRLFLSKDCSITLGPFWYRLALPSRWEIDCLERAVASFVHSTNFNVVWAHKQKKQRWHLWDMQVPNFCTSTGQQCPRAAIWKCDSVLLYCEIENLCRLLTGLQKGNVGCRVELVSYKSVDNWGFSYPCVSK